MNSCDYSNLKLIFVSVWTLIIFVSDFNGSVQCATIAVWVSTSFHSLQLKNDASYFHSIKIILKKLSFFGQMNLYLGWFRSDFRINIFSRVWEPSRMALNICGYFQQIKKLPKMNSICCVVTEIKLFLFLLL